MEDQAEAYQEEIKWDRNQYSTDLATRDTKIKEQRDKIDRLKRRCEQKDHQIAEAEAMRTNLMAAMGLSNHQSRVLAHRSRDSIPQTQQDDPTPPTPTSGDGMDMATQPEEANQSFISNASSQESRSGPTPKRPRPRKSFAAPSTAVKTRASTGAALGGKGSQWNAARRQTLGVVSGNRATTMKTPVREKKVVLEVENEEVGDETTFDGSELFAGTQGVKMMGEFEVE